MRRFKGFTLSELMVALTVIGILVAVVTPAIMKTRPNKNKMMIKKSFYITEQVVNTLINDENLYPDMRPFCEDTTLTQTATEYCAYGFDYTEATSSDGYTYTGAYKFAALFKDRLNVKKNIGSSVSGTGPETQFYPVFLTSDGIKWNLTGTNAAWTSKKTKLGTFTSHGSDTAGMGTIKVDVDSSNGQEIACTAENVDCDTYEIQILANGKMQINPEHSRASDYVTINTAIKDTME